MIYKNMKFTSDEPTTDDVSEAEDDWLKYWPNVSFSYSILPPKPDTTITHPQRDEVEQLMAQILIIENLRITIDDLLRAQTTEIRVRVKGIIGDNIDKSNVYELFGEELGDSLRAWVI